MFLKKIKICSSFLIFSICFLSVPAFALPDQEKVAQSVTHFTMGVVYDLNGETERAITEFEKSSQLADSYAVHLRLGADYARIGKMTEAIAELNKSLELDKNNIQARYLLALIYSTQKDFDKAAKEYEAILTSFSKAEPQNIEIYGYLGQLYYSQKKYDKAIEQFEIILSLDPTNIDTLFLLGTLHLELNHTDRAIELFSRALKLDPENDSCLNSLGYVYAEKGTNLDEAEKLVESALKIDPDNGAYLDTLGWVFYKKGKYPEALDALKKADSLLKDPVIYDHIGDVYYKMKQKDDAKKYWKLSLDLQPDQKQVKEKLQSVQ